MQLFLASMCTLEERASTYLLRTPPDILVLGTTCYDMFGITFIVLNTKAVPSKNVCHSSSVPCWLGTNVPNCAHARAHFEHTRLITRTLCSVLHESSSQLLTPNIHVPR